MARILHNGEWYEEISSQGMYERDFENILEQEAPRLFRDYHMVPFKTTVYSEEDADARKPDFALIHNKYFSWWVVEVELAHHSFKSHVLPQVRTLARAKYGQSEADYLCNQDSALRTSSVNDMFKGKQPRVLVIVNAPVEEWVDELRSFEAIVAICQVFRSKLNKYVLRVNGEYPSEDETVLTTCECVPMIHRMLEIHAPASLPVGEDGRILLNHNGKSSEWKRTDVGGKVYLFSVGDHILSLGQPYSIVQHGSDMLVIEAQSSRTQKSK